MADGEEETPTTSDGEAIPLPAAGDASGGGQSATDAGADGGARRAFIAAQVAGLQPLQFLMVGVPVPPFDVIQVRREHEGAWAVGVGGRNEEVAFTDEQTSALGRLGFELGEVSWAADVDGPDAAVELVERVLTEVLGAGAGAPIDIRHGSTEAEHRAEQQLAKMREQLDPIIREITGADPVVDDDGDYTVVVGQSRVFVAPRAFPGRLPIVRVFAITNIDLRITPDLALFLCRANFQLMFGRFSIDVDNESVWFDETLLGDHVTDDELRFTISMVASTADEWDDKIALQFGGKVRAPVEDGDAARPKPGEGGYL